MFDLFAPEALTLAQLRQAQIRTEFLQTRKEAQLAQTLLADELETRRFRRLYTIRHWMHRVAPRLARAWML